MRDEVRSSIKEHVPGPVLLSYRMLRERRLADARSAASFLLSAQAPPSVRERLKLLERLYAASAGVDCAHTQEEMLSFIRTILEIPADVSGCVVEAGCYKGGSTAKFSVAASAAGRKLVVFDSFEGLPANAEPHAKTIFGERPDFSEGKYRGALDEVRRNVGRYGVLSACEFVPGWFEETMPSFSESIAAMYLDVDLASSTRTCLRHLYPLLRPLGWVYSQDGHLPLVTEVLGDERFWEDEVGCPMPEIEGLGTRKLVRIRKPPPRPNRP